MSQKGNYLWGYNTAYLGFSLYDAEFSAQEFVNRQGREFDEPWEVDAFKDGFFYFMSRTNPNELVESYEKKRDHENMYVSPYER